MNRKEAYSDLDKWKKTCNKQRRKYYRKTAYASNYNQRWTVRELDIVMKHELPDSEISKLIGRSVGSIQMMRSRERKRKKMIKVLVVEPHKDPVVREIEDTLESLQNIVGGYIQYYYPFFDEESGQDDAVVICNEEGLILDLEPNRDMYGTFIVADVDETNEDSGICSLDDEKLAEFKEYYKLK